MKTFNFHQKTILLTGASSGIGACFARQLARQGARLILVARSEERLKALQIPEAQLIALDLTIPEAAQQLYQEVSQRGESIDVLINNAGFGLHGAFDKLSLTEQHKMIALNITALTELSYLFMPMLEKNQGGVLQVASMASFLASPYMAVYAATKAYVLSLGAALSAEYRPRGVRVTTLFPGATQTEFFSRAGEGAAPAGIKRARPEDVARDGLNAFVKGQAQIVSGFQNWLLSFFSRWVGYVWSASLLARMMKPKETNEKP